MRIFLENHGSLVLARPADAESAQWLRETAPEEAQFFGDGLVIEPRYVGGFCDAAQEAGIEVSL